MSSPSSDSQKIVLKTSDGMIFKVAKAVATEMQTIKHMIEDNCADACIPLPNVTSKILGKVIEYCERHAKAAAELAVDEFADIGDLIDFDAEFVKVDKSMLFNLLSAANYLSIRSLIDLTCQAIADMMKGKKPEEIRKTFNIKNDFTPEEVEKIRRENAWAFE